MGLPCSLSFEKGNCIGFVYNCYHILKVLSTICILSTFSVLVRIMFQLLDLHTKVDVIQDKLQQFHLDAHADANVSSINSNEKSKVKEGVI